MVFRDRIINPVAKPVLKRVLNIDIIVTSTNLINMIIDDVKLINVDTAYAIIIPVKPH